MGRTFWLMTITGIVALVATILMFVAIFATFGWLIGIAALVAMPVSGALVFLISTRSFLLGQVLYWAVTLALAALGAWAMYAWLGTLMAVICASLTLMPHVARPLLQPMAEREWEASQRSLEYEHVIEINAVGDSPHQ